MLLALKEKDSPCLLTMMQNQHVLEALFYDKYLIDKILFNRIEFASTCFTGAVYWALQ